jgi:hypothetical protein
MAGAKSSGTKNDRLDLSVLLTEEQLVAFTEEFGGTRLYLPAKLKEGHPIARAIGHGAALRLIEAIGAGTINVPLARDLRARYYRAQGLSQTKIARRLGMSEVGVCVMLKRLSRNGP